MNNVPPEVIYSMDLLLDIPETQAPKVTRFRPLKISAPKKPAAITNRPKSTSGSSFKTEISSDDERNVVKPAVVNNGNVPILKATRNVKKSDSIAGRLEEEENEPTLKEYLVD